MDIAFKYTGLSYLESIITKRYLWFSHIDKLNDPFECDIRAFEYSYDKYQKEKTEYFKRRSQTSRFVRQSTNHFFDGPAESDSGGKISRTISEKINLYSNYKDQRKRAFVLSLSETNLSPAMWAHYGNGFKGVCLKLDLAKLEEALNQQKYNWKRIQVAYAESKKLDYSDMKTNIEQLISFKHSDWSYEKEIRYVIWFDTIAEPYPDGIAVPVGDALTEIHVALSLENLPVELIKNQKDVLKIRQIQKAETGWLIEKELN